MALDGIYIKAQKKCPSIIYRSKDTVLCQGDPLIIPSPPKNGYYVWNNNSTNHTTEITTEGTCFYSTIFNGCTVSIDTLKVALKKCEIILTMPNLITPNDDKMNDVFTPILMKGINSLQLSVFNSWGEKVYYSDELDFEWEPSNNRSGVYYWNIDYIDRKGNSDSKKGWVHVLD